LWFSEFYNFEFETKDFRPDEWEIKRENVLVGDRIGSGCFAEVHVGKVRIKDDQLVDCAIKVGKNIFSCFFSDLFTFKLIGFLLKLNKVLRIG
jgi:hypothetical protein